MFKGSKLWVLTIGLCWAIAAAAKIADPVGFRAALTTHNVLSPGMIASMGWIGVGECVLAVTWLGLVGTSFLPQLQRAIFVTSISLIAVFAAYIFIVPGHRLTSAGCACFGPDAKVVVEALGIPARFFSVGVSGLMALFHIPVGRQLLAQPHPNP